MKKNSKKWRKKQREREQHKKTVKTGEPYSRVRNKVKSCFHYMGVPGGIVVGFCISKLVKVNEQECVCKGCGKKFPIEMYDRMEKLTHYLSNKGCIADGRLIAELSKGLEPVLYRRISENEIEYVEAEGDAVVLPRHTGIF